MNDRKSNHFSKTLSQDGVDLNGALTGTKLFTVKYFL